MKRSILLLLFVLLFHPACARKTISYCDENVVAGIQPPPFYPVNVHGGETRFLIVFGKRYNRVRGEQPYYLDIPELRSILFATEDGPEKTSIHLVNVKNKRHVRISLGASVFGHWIRAPAE